MGRLSLKLVNHIEGEIARGIEKWGKVDNCPEVLLNGATEELGEVAHAINHGEGVERAQQEIAECMGLLARLYDMVVDFMPPDTYPVTIEQIFNRVVGDYKIRVVDILGYNRSTKFVEARQVAMYLMRQETDSTLQKISELVKRSPATITHAYGKITTRMQIDSKLRRTVLNIQKNIRRSL